MHAGGVQDVEDDMAQRRGHRLGPRSQHGLALVEKPFSGFFLRWEVALEEFTEDGAMVDFLPLPRFLHPEQIFDLLPVIGLEVDDALHIRHHPRHQVVGGSVHAVPDEWEMFEVMRVEEPGIEHGAPGWREVRGRKRVLAFAEGVLCDDIGSQAGEQKAEIENSLRLFEVFKSVTHSLD